MEIGFYAGSFDPFTNGHLHVVEKSAKLFDKVIIGVSVNPDKKRRYNQEIMKRKIKKIIRNRNLTNVSVVCYDSLSVDVALEHHATLLVRGVRNGMDYEYEETLASINEEISGLDTMYIRAGSLGNISSSMVMELLQYGKDVSKYLPEEIMEVI